MSHITFMTAMLHTDLNRDTIESFFYTWVMSNVHTKGVMSHDV